MDTKLLYGCADREVSWLSFNGRVLQEAQDPTVPLFERLRFLAIYSSNLDEFFRVRVASIQSLLRLKKKAVDKLGFNPAELLRQIHALVAAQQEAFGATFRGQVVPALAQQGICLMDEHQVTAAQGTLLRTYFKDNVRSHVDPVLLTRECGAPFLKDKRLYLMVELWPKGTAGEVAAQYALVEVPSPPAPRFLRVPGRGKQKSVMFLDDVIRYNLPALFPAYQVGASYAVKLSRDADLHLEDEFSASLMEKIKKSLTKRETGLPCRFLYDQQAPGAMVTFAKDFFALEEDDLVAGGRYHNLHDLADFPRFGLRELSYEPLPPLPHPRLEQAPSMLAALAEKDQMLHLPYQSYEYVVRFLEEAAADPDVEEVWATLYRVAPDSAVVKALLKAAEQGKNVTAFVELKARFDESSNLHWAEQMEAAGVRTLYGLSELKVHAKLALVVRQEGTARRQYAYLGTGNFNEKTARTYADHGLLTADPRLTEEVRRVFDYLAGEVEVPRFEHLLVAPFDMRAGLYKLIENEIAQAEAGHEARITLKVNSLEDKEIIAQLYRASEAGVHVQLIVRGLCCLVPGVEGQSENIEARSIVDRFLEHARVYLFHNGGRERCYVASADWMGRNLDRRVEVAFPIYDEALCRELRALIDLQLADNTKARIIDEQQQNRYAARMEDETPVRAQMATYRLLESGMNVECRPKPDLEVVNALCREERPSFLPC